MYSSEQRGSQRLLTADLKHFHHKIENPQLSSEEKEGKAIVIFKGKFGARNKEDGNQFT